LRFRRTSRKLSCPLVTFCFGGLLVEGQRVSMLRCRDYETLREVVVDASIREPS
jgi:hypothetical protein